MSQPTILELADKYAKEYYMGRDEEARKRLQAAVINAETAAFTELKKVQGELDAMRMAATECASTLKLIRDNHWTHWHETHRDMASKALSKAIKAGALQ